MTDLASQRALTRSAPNLPLSWYFDPKVAEVEQRLLFARGAGYVGHEQMAPNPGDYRVLELPTLRKQVARLEHKLRRAEQVIEVQKKISELLGIEQNLPDDLKEES